MAAGSARLRIDVHGGEAREHVLDDMSFMNYRLADVRISPEITLAEPDIVWRQDGDKAIAYDGQRMTFTGPWPAGPIQKVYRDDARAAHGGGRAAPVPQLRRALPRARR